MLTAHLDLSEYVLEASRLAPRIAVDHGAIDCEQCDHLVDALGNNQSMRLAGRFVHPVSDFGNPVVLEVMPSTFQHVPVDGHRMAVAAEDAGAADTQQVAPVALRGVQKQGAEVHAIGLRHPDSLIVGDCIGDDDFLGGFGREGQLVGHP